MLDKHTGTIMPHPAIHKDAENTRSSFLKFLAPNDEVKIIYSDNSGDYRRHAVTCDGATTPARHTDLRPMIWPSGL